jgi:hypothetical protein
MPQNTDHIRHSPDTYGTPYHTAEAERLRRATQQNSGADVSLGVKTQTPRQRPKVRFGRLRALDAYGIDRGWHPGGDYQATG